MVRSAQQPVARGGPEEGIRHAVLDMTERSPVMGPLAGGRAGAEVMLDGIENVWLDAGGPPLHLDLHRSAAARATVVLQPGTGGHGRCYFLVCALLARAGYHVLAIDRPGHGLSPGPRGDCTIAESLEASRRAIDHARSQFALPVVLMGSSLGGMLSAFAMLEGQRPELAIAHNFLCPGKVISLRLRGRFIARFRSRPYPLPTLVHGLRDMSRDPGTHDYFNSEADPGMAWSLSPRMVADLYRYRPPRAPVGLPPMVLLNGGADRAIPAWASRVFLRWCGVRPVETHVLPGLGHWLFHDHLDVVLPKLLGILERRLQRA